MLQAADKPEKIAALRASYDRAVEEGWAETAALQWLDSEEDVVKKAPHLAGADIKVRLSDSLSIAKRETNRSFL
jgi:hypothetical protein